MVYIFTAMYCEAHAFIDFFHLKKDTRQTRFQVFYNENEQIRLTVTGTGMIAASVAVSSICTEYGAKAEDFLVNIGCAAGSGEKNQIFLCHKISNTTTYQTFYPDVLYRHPFLETEIMTAARPLKKVKKNEGNILYDMEASAVYQAGIYFFGTHQMSFLKAVSDSGTDVSHVTPKEVEQIFCLNMERIADYIKMLQKAGEDQKRVEPDEKLFGKLCRDLHCSKAMADTLFFYLRYCKLADIDVLSVISELYKTQRLPCKDKREGKVCFEELKKRLL